MDELQISGKRFISSRRLAREHGYTADYLGQLIRGGKVVGQKVGRAWYVDAVSFDAYLGGETSTAAIEPAQELAPVEVKEVPVVEAPVEIIQSVPVIATQEVPIKKEIEAPIKLEEEEYHVPLHIVKKEEPAEEIPQTVASGLRYYPDTEPSLPEIRLAPKESRIAQPASVQEELQVEAGTFSDARAQRSSKAPTLLLAGAAIAIFVFSAVVSSTLSLNLSIEAGNTASTSYSLHW